ncbi:MAG: hypothetical protein PHC60_02155 [Heliobacteriaceae bacterium]|nr:hypothetical protein [Heliobacteriaceae bacterium]
MFGLRVGRDETGLTLLEVIIALVIITAGFFPVFMLDEAVVAQGIRQKQEAYALAFVVEVLETEKNNYLGRRWAEDGVTGPVSGPEGPCPGLRYTIERQAAAGIPGSVAPDRNQLRQIRVRVEWEAKTGPRTVSLATWVTPR